MAAPRVFQTRVTRAFSMLLDSPLSTAYCLLVTGFCFWA
jgi:hypothetical protein